MFNSGKRRYKLSKKHRRWFPVKLNTEFLSFHLCYLSLKRSKLNRMRSTNWVETKKWSCFMFVESLLSVCFRFLVYQVSKSFLKLNVNAIESRKDKYSSSFTFLCVSFYWKIFPNRFFENFPNLFFENLLTNL